MSEGWQGACQAVSEKMGETGSFQIKHSYKGEAQYGANSMKTRCNCITPENIYHNKEPKLWKVNVTLLFITCA